MSNTFVQPLTIKHDKVDQAVLTVIRKIDDIARKCETRYVLAGAMAREILLKHVFGLAPGRRTLDVDFGIAVQDWGQFQRLKSALMEQAGFLAHPKQKQRIIHGSPAVTVDLIPFGGVERADETISWPPEEDIVMRVTGFKEALEAAVPVQLEADFVIPVVGLPLLLILKLFAWVDRKHEKRDAADIYILLRQYGDAGNEDRLYGEHVRILESEGFNFEPAGAYLLGLDAATAVPAKTRQAVREILQSDQQMTQLTNQMIASGTGFDAATARACELLVSKLKQGFLNVDQ